MLSGDIPAPSTSLAPGAFQDFEHLIDCIDGFLDLLADPKTDFRVKLMDCGNSRWMSSSSADTMPSSPRMLWYAKYHELRQKYSILPSHYIYTACRHAASIYKSFIELKKLWMCEKDRPTFKRRTIRLDKQLFKLDAEGWKVSIAVHNGRWITLRLLHGKYHEKFKWMEVGEARLVLREGNLYLHIVFRQTVVLPGLNAEAMVIAIDINENVIVYGNNDFIERFETNEGIIRTRYFLKRRRIQLKVRS